ncbi:hypothetical protein HELRODRAFT_159420 [Helobdella robusta]|uniref:Uncharacterized protein n=1 Tax=Helobdella robusta TaxID=6412 RepID=T1EP09_HELRO|nr:hypothetical protein HELRODRAFT_159420 [Helobdella robusta]ESO12833.1 hypothetical protein HELRODRAFT_159420 [Helobdella robusta]
MTGQSKSQPTDISKDHSFPESKDLTKKKPTQMQTQQSKTSTPAKNLNKENVKSLAPIKETRKTKKSKASAKSRFKSQKATVTSNKKPISKERLNGSSKKSSNKSSKRNSKEEEVKFSKSQNSKKSLKRNSKETYEQDDAGKTSKPQSKKTGSKRSSRRSSKPNSRDTSKHETTKIPKSQGKKIEKPENGGPNDSTDINANERGSVRKTRSKGRSLPISNIIKMEVGKKYSLQIPMKSNKQVMGNNQNVVTGSVKEFGTSRKISPLAENIETSNFAKEIINNDSHIKDHLSLKDKSQSQVEQENYEKNKLSSDYQSQQHVIANENEYTPASKQNSKDKADLTLRVSNASKRISIRSNPSRYLPTPDHVDSVKSNPDISASEKKVEETTNSLPELPVPFPPTLAPSEAPEMKTAEEKLPYKEMDDEEMMKSPTRSDRMVETEDGNTNDNAVLIENDKELENGGHLYDRSSHTSETSYNTNAHNLAEKSSEKHNCEDENEDSSEVSSQNLDDDRECGSDDNINDDDMKKSLDSECDESSASDDSSSSSSESSEQSRNSSEKNK